jgi:hypothetical protein
MKHGHKKGKGKASPSGKKKPAAKDKASKGISAKKSAAKAAPTRPAGKADAKGRGSDPFSFNNPIVAAAFRRAVKKYPSAFRRLTD